MKRRDLLKKSLLIPFIPAVFSPANILTDRAGSARNIIFYVYDGFSWDDYGILRTWMQRRNKDKTAFERLLQSGVSGNMDSSALTSIVTDSAAATTAWATGRKIVSGSLSWLPDGTELTTIFDLAKSRNKATGVITTTHATPAGWYAKIDWRRKEEEIALQLLGSGTNVILGGGNRVFDASKRSDGLDLYGEFRSRGYEVANDAHQMDNLNSGNVLGIFSNSHMPYEIDRKHRQLPVPELSDMVRHGLRLLSQHENGFVLQVEAGRIDHANHANDAASCLHEMIAADKTLDVLLQFTESNPDTLLILASDHATGGASVYGVGERYRRASEFFDRIDLPTASFQSMLDDMESDPRTSTIRSVIQGNHGLRISDRAAEMIRDALNGTYHLSDMQAFGRQPFNTLAYVLTDPEATYEEPGHLNIKYVSGQHTAAPVPWAAIGPGSEEIPKGMIDNTAFFGIMARALGVSHENPVMKPEEAQELMTG